VEKLVLAELVIINLQADDVLVVAPPAVVPCILKHAVPLAEEY